MKSESFYFLECNIVKCTLDNPDYNYITKNVKRPANCYRDLFFMVVVCKINNLLLSSNNN